MLKRKAIKGKERDYGVLFLIHEGERIAYLDISFSKEPAAVLRKHLRGEIPETEAFFSRKNLDGIPTMWVWEAGRVTRGKALAFLQIWQMTFYSEGYEVIGNIITTEMMESLPELSEIEKRRLKNINVADLIHGKIAKRIESECAGNERRSASQKFAVDATDDVLRVRVKEDTASRFRHLCKELGLTQNQGLEFLMAEHTKNADPLVHDLQNRLEKASSELKRIEQENEKLREDLRKSEEGKEYPNLVQVARLQNQLLCEFLKRLPCPDMKKKDLILRYSSQKGNAYFPEGKDYSYPKEEGVLFVNVEHMQYSKGHPSCLLIYCRNEKREKIKIRWYREKNIQFGESMWDSPYLWENSPWVFAVRKDRDAMELVGSIPDLFKIWFKEDSKGEEHPNEKKFADWMMDVYFDKLEIKEDHVPSLKTAEEKDIGERTPGNGFLDDMIRAAENKKRK